MQSAPYWLASRTPVHFAAGCGGRHRFLPTGGAAYGIPLKATTPPETTPRSLPVSTVASFTAASAIAGAKKETDNR